MEETERGTAFERDSASTRGRLEREERVFSAERLVFFSDAVVAIAITLLALDLPYPENDTWSNAEVLSYFNDHREAFIAFGISFLVIARSWQGHHHLFGFVETLAPGLMRWNMWWLLMIVLTPFATRVLTGGGAFQVRFVMYAAAQTLTGLFFALIVWSVAKGGVLKENTPPDLVSTSFWRLLSFAAAFLISIPVAFFTQWAYACWAVIPLIGGFVGRWVRNRSGSTADGLR